MKYKEFALARDTKVQFEVRAEKPLAVGCKHGGGGAPSERKGAGRIRHGERAKAVWHDATANGLEDVAKMPALVAVLLKRGYAEADLKKILGGNFLRVIREVVG
jgi:microsomal dipeptidase-like Zn-dependent dipeptidase